MVISAGQGLKTMNQGSGASLSPVKLYSPVVTKGDNEHEMSQRELEALWLSQAREGSRPAFGKLVGAFQRPVYNLAYRMLSNSREAEEAAQEAFIRAWTRLHSYNPAHKFSTWMLTITSNYCIDLLRKRRAILLSIDEPLPSHPALMSEKGSGPEASAVASEREILVQKLLTALPDEYREAVVLRYWYDLSYDEIAEAMGTTVSAIKSRLFRARKHLADAGVEMGMSLQTS